MSVDTVELRALIAEFRSSGDEYFDNWITASTVETILDELDALRKRVETAEWAAVWIVYYDVDFEDNTCEKIHAVCASVDIAKARVADFVKGFSSYNPLEPIEYWEYEGDFEAYQGVDGSRQYFYCGYRECQPERDTDNA